MIPMQQQSNVIEETKVATVIELLERKVIQVVQEDTFRGQVYNVLAYHLFMKEEDITYWLDHFGLS